MADVKQLIALFEEMAKKKPSARVVDAPPRAKPGSGAALPSDVRKVAEQAFGMDFSKVRIHEDASVKEIGAKAYVSGNDIVFAPGSSKDLKLLAHDLAHVVQQRGGPAKGKCAI